MTEKRPINYHRPVRTVLVGDKNKAAQHAGDAKRALFQLRNLEGAGSDLNTLRKLCADGSRIKVHTKVFGMDVVEIESFSGGEWELIEETVLSEIVPIVELRNSMNVDSGFAAFDVNADGTWGKPIGYTTAMNLEANQDPPAPITEQLTYRDGWCKIRKRQSSGGMFEREEKEISVTQLPRIDGSYMAYDGYPSDYEDGGLFATAMESFGDDGSITGEDDEWMDESGRCEPVVTPGPPPSDLCGYDWTMCGDSYYDGETGLFWGAPLTSYCGIPASLAGTYWPEHFNQKIEFSPEEKQIGVYWMQVETGDSDSTGTHKFSRVYKTREVFNNGYKLWGLVWAIGSGDMGISDSFPYLAPSPVPLWHIEGETFGDEAGIYVYDNYDIYIYGMLAYHNYRFDYTGWYTKRRNPRTPGVHFQNPDLLSEEVLTLLAGNTSYPYDPPFPSASGSTTCQQYIAGENVFTGEHFGKLTQTQFIINAGGVEYDVYTPPILTASYMYGGTIRVTEEFSHSAVVWDLGIFSSKSVITQENPVYGYVIRIDQDTANEIPYEVILGIIIKGVNYKTPQLPYTGSTGAPYLSYFTYPDFEPVDADGNRIYLIPTIRAGIKKTVTKKYKRKMP